VLQAKSPSPIELGPVTQQRGTSPAMPAMASNKVSGFGVLMHLRRNALGAFPERCLNEPVVKLRMPGGHLVMTAAPDAIAHLMITHGEDYVRVPFGRRVLGPIVGQGLVTSEGDLWRRQRRAISPAFTPRNLPVLTQHIIRCVEVARTRLIRACDQPVDMLNEMQELSLEIASTSLFSLEAERFGSELRSMVSEYMRTIGRLYPTDVFLPDIFPTPVRVQRALFKRRWRKLIKSIIAMRRQAGNEDKPRDLFDLLAQAYGSGNDELLVDETATMLVAGHETTALTLFWACSLLAESPHWQATLATEAANTDLSESAAASSLSKLTNARAVIQETLRLYSPAFMSARIANKSHDICGTEVPKGSLVLVPFWLLHRDPRWWPRPTQFDPSRFTTDTEPAKFTFLPFGIGRHVCIGAQLAMAESTLAIAALMRDLSIRRIDDRPVMPVARVTTRPEHAPKFLLQTRAPSARY
jgi:cytochrome P450